MSTWKIWMDTGGTFTDCIAINPAHQTSRLKVLSSGVLRGKIIQQLSARSYQVEISLPVARDIFKGFDLRLIHNGKSTTILSLNPDTFILTTRESLRNAVGQTFEISSQEEVPVFAARLLTQTGLSDSFPPIEIKLGSTRGTNALLERKGARTALITTEGFKDLLLIGTQQRPDLFALEVKKESPLYAVAFEISERIAADGKIITKISKQAITRLVVALKKAKIDSVAIALINSYANPFHELLIAKKLKQAGFRSISTSHSLSGQLKIVPRAETTVANAYLAPIIHSYVGNIQRGLAKAQLKIMTSAGSLSNAQHFYPKDSLLSGPAGGVVGAATVGRLSNIHQLITFDMGGTSTDVSLYNNRLDYRFESKVGDTKILSPSVAIETIAAGGGSICDFDGFKLTVGPHSAGAYPGPACYGAGGPLTITDVNLLLGRLDSEFFAIPIYPEKSQEAFDRLAKKMNAAQSNTSSTDILEALIQIANEKMAETIKRVSVQQGHSPADFTLLCFGGAGGQHTCALASILGMHRILIPYDAGLLSAYGIGHANSEAFEEQLILAPLNEVLPQLDRKIESLFNRGAQKLIAEGHQKARIKKSKQLIFLRFAGQESTLEIEFKNPNAIKRLFKEKYTSIYGHWVNNRVIEVESVLVILTVEERRKTKRAKTPIPYQPKEKKKGAKNISIYQWEDLRCGATISGPALVISHNSTTYVERNWKLFLDGNNHAILERSKNQNEIHSTFTQQALLELFSNRFTSVAQEMGAMLQRTSFSVNVKERLDFSCAVLDAQGYLIVNAPHIPVHLGSMGVCVREILKVIAMQEGDVIITNHPAYGGSHLPDVTLIKPVFFQKKLVGYVANRAHHAEIGGKKPGSMPVDATTLEEEGVIIVPTYLVRAGKPQWKAIENLFNSARYPSRSVQENLADLNGALASVNLGEKNLQDLCARYGSMEVCRQMTELKRYASGLLENKLHTLPQKTLMATEYLDDGAPIKVALQSQQGKLHIDFSGSANVHKGNLNATRAIVQSAVLYVLRLWVNQPIAMNEGLMELVEIHLPKGMLNPFADFDSVDANDASLPAVVGGNTEISQRLTDTLLKALGLVACSQGTMNNFLFGNERLGYYETIGGGTGAGKGFDGCDAIHSHMTNTRITDPEILELKYPVQLEKFAIRKNSGGSGKWKGGNGITRQIKFNEAMDINILSQHRKQMPYGINGGGSGKCGEQFHITASGKKRRLKGMDSLTVQPGERILIHTPGGGGWGK
ncbi:MAG: hydantoinase B/oxoprolinase family protein [Cyclobacteriaceae bacterium]|jgi:5-oxoprolinase (ATP-hydrolysing)